jgi:hypothetical protein
LIRDKERVRASAIFRSSATEDGMRIFERLRGKERNESGIERRLVETVFTDLLGHGDEEVLAPVVAAAAKPNCCSCCSAEAENR